MKPKLNIPLMASLALMMAMILIPALRSDRVMATSAIPISSPTQPMPAPCEEVRFFQPSGSPFDGGGAATGAAAADFNLDGKPDLAMCNGGNFFSQTDTVTILLGDGSGGFAESSGSPVTVGSGPYSITVADFNRDGKPDIATADIFSEVTSVLLGDGTGGFAHTTGSPFSITDIHPTAVTAGDWNEDGNPDIAISSTFFGTSRVAIMLGDGTGGFAAASGSPVELTFGWNPIDIAMSDFNLDGNADIVTANLFGFNVAALLGDGNAGFTVIGSPAVSTQAIRTVQVGDFNLDGNPDVSVTASRGFVGETGHLIVMLGDGQGQFTEAPNSPYPTGDDPFDQAVADFNLDGNPDIAVLNDANNVKLLLGDGTGRFNPPANSLLTVGDFPNAITSGDFNLDGRPDLAVGTFIQNLAVILLNNCAPVARCRDVTVQAGPACNANASVDDGSFDPNGDNFTVTQTPPGPYPKGATTVTLTIADSHGASASCTATVTVVDAQAPTLGSCPASVVMSTDLNSCSAVVTYTAPVASDNCGSATVTCNPPSGSTFMRGTTTVICAATDTSGNQTSCSFTVTVNDTQPPSITCPSDLIRSTDTDQCSAIVTYPSPTASDNCSPVTAMCNPPSGATFPKGVTTVNCAATDSSSNSAVCSFTIAVEDDQPPDLSCPANLTVTTIRPGDSSIAVNYPSPAASDNCAGVSVACSPASGSVFPLGVTTVSCLARDDATNKAACSFTVSVFDNCLEDDSQRSAVLLFNSQSGDYRFRYAGGMLAGRGGVTRKGNVFTLVDNRADRRVQATVDANVRRGSASLQSPPGQVRCSITDRNTTDNSCACGAGN
ncbi:MAG: HYR domain-containing protein [Acidobacteriota bacterium]